MTRPTTLPVFVFPLAKLDQFVDLVGELVTGAFRLSELAACRMTSKFAEVSEEIERLTSSLRDNSMNSA